MANNLQIKRSAHDATANPTGSQLEFGELGWNNGENRLWIGRATDNSADGSPAPFEIVGRQATATTPGAAGFSADNFAISAADYANDDGSIVTIKAGGVANAELANSSVTIGSTAVSLGATAPSIAGLTGLDFTNADCTIGATVGDGTVITIGGHVNSQVKIKGDLLVEGDTTTVSSTTVTVADKTFVLGDGSTSANLDEGGLLFSDVASIKWDHDTTKLKSSHVITGSYVDTTYTVGDGGLTQKNFTTTLKSKLDGIEASATADQTGGEMRTLIGTGNGNLVPTIGTVGHFLKHDGTFGALPTDSDTTYTFNVANATTKLTLNPSSGSGQDVEVVGAGSVSVARTNASKLTITGVNTTYTVGDGGLTQKNFTTTLKDKLDGIAAGATNTAAPHYTSAIAVGDGGLTQKNFTTTLKDKLDGIAAGATNTAAPYYTAAIAVGAGGLTQQNFTTTLKTKLDGIAASATNTPDWTTSGVGTIHAHNYTNTTYAEGDHGLTQANFTDTLRTKLNGIATGANAFVLDLASGTVRGGVKIGYVESGKNYPVELSSEKMFVNVPWTDTTYTLTLAAINTVTGTTGAMISANSTVDCGSVTWGS
jgi:hypothetical protein